MTGLFQLAALTALLGGLAGTGVAAVWWWLRRDAITALPPGRRTRRLAAVTALPLVGAALLLGTALLPSVLDAAGLITDHCHIHPNHHFHLCLVHASHIHASSTGWLALGIAALAVGSRLVGTLRTHARVRRRLRELLSLARPSEDDRFAVVDSERLFAATAGLFDPRVFVSRGLRDRLEGASLEMVTAHEHAHAHHSHGLAKLALAAIGSLHLPGVARDLRREFDLACEQIADREAAESVGDPVAVAETLIRVERLRTAPPVAPERSSFGASDIERRVESLLESNESSRRRSFPLLALAGCSGLAMLANHQWIHHALETVLSYVIS
ncbi:MAG: M48 family metalloprotease [Bradymonadaceae bacterium]